MTTTPLSRLPWHPVDWLTCMVSPVSVENSGGGSPQLNGNGNGQAGSDSGMGQSNGDPNAEGGDSGKAQSTDTPPQFEVVAVVPIEFFTPGNRDKVREELKRQLRYCNQCKEEILSGNKTNSDKEIPCKHEKNFFESDDDMKIRDHIKNFSVYEYEIFSATPDKACDWRKVIWERISSNFNEELKKECSGKGELQIFLNEAKISSENTKNKERGTNNAWIRVIKNIEVELIFAAPFKGNKVTNDKTSQNNTETAKETSGNDESEDEENDSITVAEADMNTNTGATIVIVIKVLPCTDINLDEESSIREEFADILKTIGDSLNIEINNNQKGLREIYDINNNKNGLKETDNDFNGNILESHDSNKSEPRDPKCESLIYKIYTELLAVPYYQMKKEEDKINQQNEAENSCEFIHDHIEINYVFTYFICSGFDFYIIAQNIENIDDNIKYSGDAWFLRENKIYINRKHEDALNKDEYKYVSEEYYNSLPESAEKLDSERKKKGYSGPFKDDFKLVSSKYDWIVEKLIPEVQVRPGDLYYIPKLNGGGYNDFSSILLKHSNKLCCFIKGKYVNNAEADDRNRIIAMQIIVNAFWHRMTDFSRVMGKICLNLSKAKNLNNDETKIVKLDKDAERDFVNQIYTTPTLKEQIADINSTDQDVATLIDFAKSDKMLGASKFFIEQRKIYLDIRSEGNRQKRENEVNEADQKIQIAIGILALITIPIGIIEIWVSSEARLWSEILTTVIIGVLVVAGILMFVFWKQIQAFRKKRKQNPKNKN